MENRYCSQCKHMLYYDWYNCTNKKFEGETEEEVKNNIKDQNGLELDNYWGFIRICDEKRHEHCIFFEPFEEEDNQQNT